MAAPHAAGRCAGLEFGIIGQSRRIEIINGATLLATTATIVRVTPQTCPAYSQFLVPHAAARSLWCLRVNPDNGSNSSSASRVCQLLIARQPAADGGAERLEPEWPASCRLTARPSCIMNIPKRDIYVGESIPVEIQVGTAFRDS